MLGNAQIARITPAQVRVWQARLRDEGLAAASMRQARQVLSAALDVAAARMYGPHNPARGQTETVRALVQAHR